MDKWLWKKIKLVLHSEHQIMTFMAAKKNLQKSVWLALEFHALSLFRKKNFIFYFLK